MILSFLIVSNVTILSSTKSYAIFFYIQQIYIRKFKIFVKDIIQDIQQFEKNIQEFRKLKFNVFFPFTCMHTNCRRN